MKRTLSESHRGRSNGLVVLELVVAMGILSAVMLPLAFSIVQEQRLARAYYFRAVALEVVDGEMEVLRAGEWRAFSQGQHEYPVHSNAVTNLPPGRFVLSLNDNRVRLEWRPSKPGTGGPVVRQATIPRKEP